jgi:hypothetical protein
MANARYCVFRKQLALLFALPVAVAWCIVLCQGEPAAPSVPIAPIRFRNVASAAGIDFVLENGATPEKHGIEMMVGGVAAFDFDGDGLTDIFFANGATSPLFQKTSPKYSNRLYRNLGGMRFKDVTAEAGLSGEGYCHGAAAEDHAAMVAWLASDEAEHVIGVDGGQSLYHPLTRQG